MDKVVSISSESKPPEKKKYPRVPYLHDPVPSAVIRQYLDVLNLVEIRCYLYIADHTRGYRKEWDEITISQFCEGQKAKSGERIDCGTGYKRNAVRDALESLYLKGFIRLERRHRHATKYALTHPDHIMAEAIRATGAEKIRKANLPPDIGKKLKDRKPETTSIEVA